MHLSFLICDFQKHNKAKMLRSILVRSCRLRQQNLCQITTQSIVSINISYYFNQINYLNTEHIFLSNVIGFTAHYVAFDSLCYKTPVGVEHLIALLTLQCFQIPLTPRVFPVWDFVVGIFALKALLNLGRVLSTPNC